MVLAGDYTSTPAVLGAPPPLTRAVERGLDRLARSGDIATTQLTGQPRRCITVLLTIGGSTAIVVPL